jgi:hypothetical protein
MYGASPGVVLSCAGRGAMIPPIPVAGLPGMYRQSECPKMESTHGIY